MKYMDYILETLERIVNTPSPSGYTKEVMEIIRREAENFGFQTEFNRKGGLIITVPGQTEHVLGFSAHVDTLGAMVRSVRANGTLALKLLPDSDERRQEIYRHDSDKRAVCPRVGRL